MSVRNATLSFPQSGLVLVQGCNLAARGKMQSIGSGKTALGEAICRALLGVSGRYTQLGRYSYKGRGDALIVVQCTHRGQPLSVELGYKAKELNPTSEALRFTYAGEQCWRDRLANTRQDLARLLAVTPELAAWTIHLDGDRLKFDDIAHKDSVSLLMAALAQPPWDQFHRKANETVTALKRTLAGCEAVLASARQRLAEAEMDLEAATASLETAQQAYEKTLAAQAKLKAEAQARQEDLAKKLAVEAEACRRLQADIKQAIAESADAAHEQEILRNQKLDAYQALSEQLSALSVQASLAKQHRLNAQRALQDLRKEPTLCPTCRRPLESKVSAAQIAAAERALTDAQRKEAEAQAQLESKQAEADKARAAHRRAADALQQLRSTQPVAQLSQEFESHEARRLQLEAELRGTERDLLALDRPPDRSSVVSAEATVKVQTSGVQQAKAKIQDAGAQVAESAQTLRVAEYWQRAFGPGGIPNMVLREAVPPLNDAAQRISARMTGSSLQIVYETSKTLASGDHRNELNIRIKNPDGAEWPEGGSKGEGSLTNLIVAEALAEVGGIANRIGYRWYDEVGANADELVRRSVFAYLREMANRQGILIFLTSHAPEAANYADYVLLAEKTAVEGTTYRWI